MRVLHVGKFFAPFSGGIENFMLDLMRGLDAAGIVQAAVVHEHDPGSGPEEAAEVGPLPFEVRRVAMPMQVAYAPVSPGFGRALDELLQRFRPDLLHLHMPNTSAFWALASRRARALPWVVHWHSDAAGPGLGKRLKLLYPFYRPLEQALLRRAEAVVATTPPYLESSPALRRWRGKCRVLPLGLDPGRATFSESEAPGDWRCPGKLRVLSVGRLSRYKGMEVLAEAAARVEGLELVIAGAGERRQRIEALAARAPGRIRLAGAVSDAERNRLIVSCDVFCLPSINRAEAFGLALVEAMAAGKPVIATRVPGAGMAWVVEPGRNGWLVEPADADDLSRLLADLCGRREVLERAGGEARSSFDARFRIDEVARGMERIYAEAVHRRSGSNRRR